MRAFSRNTRLSAFAFVDTAGIPDRTARRLLAALREHGILQVFRADNDRRGTILVFPELLNIAEGRDVF